MALADIMTVEMSEKYMADSSSSSSLSSDSDDLSSSSSSISSSSASSSESSSASSAVTRRKPQRGRGPSRKVALKVSDSSADSDLDLASTVKRKKKVPRSRRSPTKAPPKAKAKAKKASVAAKPPPSLPPPPPPSSPPPAESSSSNSSLHSSSSSSSSDSSDFSESEEPQKAEPVPPPPPASAPAAKKSAAKKAATAASAAPKAPKRRAAAKKTPEVSPQSLKVTLKLPPGFIAKNGGAAVLNPPLPATNRSKMRVQVTNSSSSGAAAPKRPRTGASAATTRKTGVKVSAAAKGAAKKKAQPAASRSRTKKASTKAPPPAAIAANGALPAAPLVPLGPPLLPKLIPKGPTVPAGEVRGAKELSLVNPDGPPSDRPAEVLEQDIPAQFNDPIAHENEKLRNLDLFFFCDEQGRPISLEILDRPKDERPKIMGFGTLVAHLPLAERPLPVKHILPSPAFPSRSKKRPRADSSASTPSKSSAAKSRGQSKVNAAGNKNRKRVKVGNEQIFQADGEVDDDMELEQQRVAAGHSIFQRAAVYRYPSPFYPNHVAQLDGQSDSESGGSDLTSDDEDAPPSGQSGSDVDNESELLSSAVSSSSGSGSDNDLDSSNSSSSSSGSEVESGDGTTTASRRSSTTGPTPSKTLARGSSAAKATPSPKRTTRTSPRVDSRTAGLPHDVVELMRTDRVGDIGAKGTEDELNLMECGFRHPPEYARARVWLPEITDWCLDYAEGDPTLWVITPHAWYKIAGPLSGLLPHSSYRKTFQHVRHLFEASYLVAYVLKEWLPINKKVSYRATLQQIVELSLKGRYRVSAWFLIKNYRFIRNQISDLFPDKEVYLESMFFKQLHRLNENYTIREAKHQKEQAEREVRRAKRENERQKRRQRVEDERQRMKEEREEERKQKEQEQKYPIEDLKLLEGEETDHNVIPLTCAGLDGVEGSLLGELIMAWQTISTFKDFVGLESISLEALVECITTRCEEGTHIGLARIFMAFLRVILSEKSFTSLLDDLVVEGNIKVSDLFVNSERTYGICERPYADILNAVTWQEILRQLMSKDLGIDPSIGHVEPLVGCEIVRQTLYMQTNSVAFNSPVDTTLKGLEDYPQIIKHPMDLGTIKKKIDSGEYEGPEGHDSFAADVRLVWDNAVLYNGEESEVGRAALALSDIFEQDYERFVVGQVRANKSRIEGCKKIKATLKDESADKLKSFKYTDVVYGLYCFEFHQLPTAYKIGALSWICSEFLTLSSIRTYLASQVEQEMLIHRNHRKRAADIDSRRKRSDRLRREKEIAFRLDCINQGIHPNSHNVFSEGIKRKYEFIPKFFEDLHAEKTEDENMLEQEKTTQMEEMTSELNSIIIRESPVGKDRYHNCYWMFKNDSKPRLFVERSDSGDFAICRSKTELMGLLEWLNPKGVRELELSTKLGEVKDKLLHALEDEESKGDAESKQDADTAADIVWNAKGGIELQLFPLPGGAFTAETMVIADADKVLNSHKVAQEMLLCLHKHLADTGTLPASWNGGETWCARVKKATKFEEQRDLFAELENVAVTASGSKVETIRPSWQRKRHEWRLGLEGSCTYSQLVFLLHLLLEEFIHVEAFMDLHIRLDRREWLKLRPKESRNFIPEAGKTVVYFGEGHAQALKEDEKTKKKRFTQKSDAPVRNTTAICTVNKVSYHHGAGDPYALVELHPIADLASQSCVREPGSLLCPLPSRAQRLARIFLRILAKLKVLTDAGPFLEPVSDRDFPQYKEIILHPMDLGKMTTKAGKLEYKNAVEFMADMRLLCSNCELFCEGRFPTLPPLAHNLVAVADGLIKKWAKDIRVCEDGASELTATTSKSRAPSPEKTEPVKASEPPAVPLELPTSPIVTILRLENRLPEYVVDINRYVWAVDRTWRCGEKFRMLFRKPQGQPGEYYGGVTAGALPFNEHGMLPWEALRVTWDEDDGSDDNRINPWEAEFPRSSK